MHNREQASPPSLTREASSEDSVLRVEADEHHYWEEGERHAGPKEVLNVPDDPVSGQLLLHVALVLRFLAYTRPCCVHSRLNFDLVSASLGTRDQEDIILPAHLGPVTSCPFPWGIISLACPISRTSTLAEDLLLVTGILQGLFHL